MTYRIHNFAARVLTCMALFSLLLPSSLAVAISVGQLDDFEDGSRQNWSMGQQGITNTQLTIEDGGPAGAGDSFLQVRATGVSTGGGRLTTFNRFQQWSGDYTSAGITAISMDLKNIESPEPLNIRLAINGGIFLSPGILSGGLFATTASVQLESGSDWTHVVFALQAGDLTSVSGGAGNPGNNAAATLANVTELRIINSAIPSLHGDPIVATLGIDNISAVPLPPALLLFASGLLGLGILRRR